ncbi:hypothetical protein [Rhodanobacter sp. C01]|uniref:hypothetical protein n=1 Tax=Rhodanobacter sp. C01 TaxID=1945856 RepID=UPI000984A361|nr:hypothetical protein [Rhodanobacter sp. C01]OOG51071.1 hypothetical protein B0E50_02540 [Rhodanobacter sp. C01]
MLTTSSQQPRRATILMLAAVVMLAIAAAHSFYVSLFAGDLPFWDQWSQISAELAPWWQDHANLHFLFTAHNEHRIFFTRLVSMALLAINDGHWSNLAEAYINTLIYSSALALLFAFSAWDIRSTPMRLLLLLCVIGMGCLPFDWENTLVGFQNQFYFMLAAATALLAVAAYTTDTWTRLFALLALGLASLFTMASGLIAPLAAAFVLVMRGLPTRAWSVRTVVAVGGLLAITMAGLLLLPHLPGDVPMQAKGLPEHAHGMLLALNWPLAKIKGGHPLFMLLLWLPACLGLTRVLRGTRTSRGELFLLGILGWIVLQAFAIAHARGHDMAAIPSRYTSILVAGGLANLALGMLWACDPDASSGLSRTSRIWLIATLPILFSIMLHRTHDDLAGMKQRGIFSLIETANLSGFISTDDERFLQHPGLEIPYPSAKDLTHYLANPKVREMVTASVSSAARPTAPLSVQGPLTVSARGLRHEERVLLRSLSDRSPQVQFQQMPAAISIAKASGAHGQCTVDALNGDKPLATVTMHPYDAFTLQGWIIWPGNLGPGRDVLVLRGKSDFTIELTTSADRKDVIRVMRSAPSLTRGFFLGGDLGGVAPDVYSPAIARESSGGYTAYCELPFTVTVNR